jgi:glycosyltransferase involved in cell wall biosynthesis
MKKNNSKNYLLGNKIQHVLFLSSWYPNKKDALDGNFVQNHARAVSTKIPVTVLFATSLKNITSNYILEVTRIENLCEIRVYFKWHSWKIVRLARTLYAYYIGLRKVSSFDLIHANVFFNAGILGVILGVWKQKPVVVSEHSSWFNTVEKIPFWKRYLLKLFQKGICFFMPVSHSLGKKLIEVGVNANKVLPVANVIDTNVFFYKSMPVNAKTTFLHVSNFKEHHKNMEGILRVIAALGKAGHDFHFIFVGDGDIEALQEKCHKLGIDKKNIVFHATKIGVELAYFYQLADAFVLFSRYENLPCVLLESLCCGTPVITTRVGGIAEIIDKNGFLIESENEKALYDAMLQFIDGKQTFSKHEIASKAQKYYDVQAICSQIIAHYQKTV